jgi:hypothetical protein
MITDKITQENFRILLPGKIAAVAEKIAADRHCSLKEALITFYLSDLYRELETEKTKRWWESPSQLYWDFARAEVLSGTAPPVSVKPPI